MAMLRRENNLAVLRAQLIRRRGTDALVAFETQIGAGEPHGIATWQVGDVASRSDSVESLRELPPDVAAAIVRGGEELLEHPAVWLELAEPAGFLPLLPWEAMLSPILPRPVLRLPYFMLRPSAAMDSLDVVLCATNPLATST